MAKKTKKIETPIDQRETFVSIQKNFADSDLSVEEKLKTLYSLQLIDTEIDKILQLRGELPVEVENLENEIADLKAKVAGITAQIEESTKKIAEYKNRIVDYDARHTDGPLGNVLFQILYHVHLPAPPICVRRPPAPLPLSERRPGWPALCLREAGPKKRFPAPAESH